MSRIVRPRFVATALAVVVAASCEEPVTNGGYLPPHDVVSSAAATITPDELGAKIWTLAHDSMRGRATPSPELDAAALWIAQRFAELGLEAPFDGSYEQRFAIRVVSPDPTRIWASSPLGDTVRLPSDLSLPYGAPAVESEVDASVVSVGIDAVEAGDPSYRGRHVLLWGTRSSSFRSSAGVTAVARLRSSGAVAIWQVTHTDASPEAWVRASGLGAMQARTVLGDGAGDVPVIGIRRAALRALLGGASDEAEEGGRGQSATVLDGTRLTLRLALSTVSSEEAPNVAGLLRGSDPALADEVIVYSAHMDHVGVGRPDLSGDSIYNGADDDASGTAAVMEVAEAFATMDPAPRRSVMFLLVSGEERGLWGSEYFADHPPVPVEAIVANINADMVGRNWSDTIVVIGKEHSELGPMLEAVNARHPELGMTAIDDLWPGENFYGRSDHFNFARKGVPILFFFNGTHDDYHQPSDDPSKIDTDKAARIAQLMFRLGVEVASRPEPPAWRESSRRRIVEGR